MEAHLVHESDDNRIAVIGIIYKIGCPDSFLSMIQPDLQAIADTHDIEKIVGIIDPKLIKFGSIKYYRYIGSLTVPPCTQNIVWTVLKKVRTVAQDQVLLIRKAVDDAAEANARPVQPLNERWIYLYKPKHHQLTEIGYA
ncbi:Carbonate dehydratase [Handroanthus impetiginosus]|uniref:Carbonate dehydratase n=1 Tax=Handroanthus impetiginosus TaxID=429701 RepID=A0A2G9G0D6_9LAMI|nr:Carbonate dehydratase [Handroanthus impetiginosus]PIM98651.1 Carbonate dehydratase [Handroanthus impetiginosus]